MKQLRLRFVVGLIAALSVFTTASLQGQGPFPAQIQAAFQQLGLWPYGIYTNGSVPTFSTASNRFLPGGGSGSSSSATQFISTAGTTCAAPALTSSGAATSGVAIPATPGVLLCVGGTARVTLIATGLTITVPILGVAGTGALPGIAVGTNDKGMYEVSATELGYAAPVSMRWFLAGGTKAQFSTDQFNLASTTTLGWGSSGVSTPDLFLTRQGAGYLFQRNGSNAQRAAWASNYTGTTNFTSLDIDWQTTAGELLLGTRTAATGTQSILKLVAQANNAADNYAMLRIDRSTSPFFSFGLSGAAGSFGSATGAVGNWIQLARLESSATSGSVAAVAITPTYNQASGNATNTDLLINRTETAVGSGAQLFIDMQIAGSSRFRVSTGGTVFLGAGASRFQSTTNALLNFVSADSAFGVQFNSGTAAPTFNNGTVGTGSRNSTGSITLTGANTGGTVTFGAPNWTNTPFCVLTGTAATDNPYITATSATAFTVAGMTANGTFTYICIGRI